MIIEEQIDYTKEINGLIISDIPHPNHINFLNLLTEPKTKFDKLTIIEYLGFVKKHDGSRHFWLCQCDCGNIRPCSTQLLTSNQATQCKPCRGKHRMYKTTEYQAWADMKTRCSNGNNRQYKDYGGRGITYCERWEKFENFYEDMGEKPEPKKDYSLDRFPNNDGNYEKDNCRWATRKEQADNRRTNVKFNYKGNEYTLNELAKIAGMTAPGLSSRFKTMSIEEAVEKPKRII